MKEKTRKRLERKFLALPLHHIDTNVIIESTKVTKLGNVCSDYLNRVGYKYRGTISLSVLGELLLVTLRDYKSIEDKEIVLRRLNSLIKKSKIQFLTPLKSTYQTTIKVMELDTRIEPTDALNYSMAIQEGSTTFVSFDENMVNNITLENTFGVKIKHPNQL